MSDTDERPGMGEPNETGSESGPDEQPPVSEAEAVAAAGGASEPEVEAEPEASGTTGKSRRRTRVVRPPGLAVFGGFCLVVAGLWILLADAALERGVEEIGASFTGARVDLESADIRITEGSVAFTGLQVADPEEPFRNLADFLIRGPRGRFAAVDVSDPDNAFPAGAVDLPPPLTPRLVATQGDPDARTRGPIQPRAEAFGEAVGDMLDDQNRRGQIGG